MPKPGGLDTLATALPSLLVQLHHTASHGTIMNESLSCLESTEVTEELCLWVSAKSGTEPGTEPQAQTGSSRGHCPGGAPFCPHSHSALFLFKTRQEWAQSLQGTKPSTEATRASLPQGTLSCSMARKRKKTQEPCPHLPCPQPAPITCCPRTGSSGHCDH